MYARHGKDGRRRMKMKNTYAARERERKSNGADRLTRPASEEREDAGEQTAYKTHLRTISIHGYERGGREGEREIKIKTLVKHRTVDGERMKVPKKKHARANWRTVREREKRISG